MNRPVIQCDFTPVALEPVNRQTFQQLEQKKQTLDEFRPLSPEQTANLKKLYDVDLTYNSNAIEGSTLSYAETKLILEEGITVAGKKLVEHLEAINHKEALDFIEELARQSSNPISEHDLLSLHNLILRGIDTKKAGKYRTVPVGVRQSDGELRYFCDPLQVPERMQRFFAWIQQSIGIDGATSHPVQYACDAHYYLVTIHPFIDGNGRTARLLMNLMLIQHGYPPAVIKVKDRLEYIMALERAQNQGERNSFYGLVCRAVDESLDLYLETLAHGTRYV